MKRRHRYLGALHPISHPPLGRSIPAILICDLYSSKHLSILSRAYVLKLWAWKVR